MTKQQAIEKYNLKEYKPEGVNVYFELYQNSTEENGIQKFYNLDNEMSKEFDNGKIFFLTVQTINNNKLKYNKKRNEFMPTTRTKVIKIIE